MGYVGWGMAAGIGTGIIQGQNGTGMGSENIGTFVGSTAKHAAIGAGAGVAMNVAGAILGKGKGARNSALGVAATIAGGAFMASRF